LFFISPVPIVPCVVLLCTCLLVILLPFLSP
jgi:hypothetical protein